MRSAAAGVRMVRVIGVIAGSTLILMVSACGAKKEAAEEASPSTAARKTTPSLLRRPKLARLPKT